MANYKNMMELIDEYIYENRYQKITGTVLNTVLREMVSSLGAGYQLAGILRASDNPKAADQRVAYLAVEPGTFQHAGGFEVTELSLLTYGAEWHMHPLGVPFGSKIAEDIAAAVTVEKTRAMAAEKALNDAVTTEKGERMAADSTLDSAIKAETKRATDAEGANAAAITSEADARAKADTTLQGNITAEETARKAADTALGTRVTSIEDKIPAQATAENKLADKDFVNSSIATSTATFRGTFETLEALKAAQADKNDYAFWVHKDEDGNTCYDKYTYDGAEWRFEYRLNNSSFTAAQWAALNSGVTADVIAALQEADRATAAALAQETADRKAGDKANADAVAAEKTRAQAAEKANADAIAKEAADREAADAALQAAIDALPSASIELTYDLDAQELFGGTMSEVAAALEKGANVSVKIQNGDAEFASPTSVLRVIGHSYAAPAGPLLLHAVSPRYDAAADEHDEQDNFNSIVFQWTDGGNVALYRFTPQAALESGKNIMTINGESVLGSGNLSVCAPSIKTGWGLEAEVFNGVKRDAALGYRSHAEGEQTTATGDYSHAEGRYTVAAGERSHAEGNFTHAAAASGHAEGEFNVIDMFAIHQVGIGTTNDTRRDAHRITSNGKHYILGIGGFDGTKETRRLTNEKDLATVISELESASGPFALAFTLGTGDKWAMDCTFEELAAAVDAKRGVIFTVNNGSYDGNLFTATLQQHDSAENVVVLQGYVNWAFIYVVVTNGTTGLTVDVNEVDFVVPNNANVPGTKAVKDYVDSHAPCVIVVDSVLTSGVAKPYVIKSGELSPDRVITLQSLVSSGIARFNVFGFQNSGSITCHGYVVNHTTGEMIKLVFNMPEKTLTASGDI